MVRISTTTIFALAAIAGVVLSGNGVEASHVRHRQLKSKISKASKSSKSSKGGTKKSDAGGKEKRKDGGDGGGTGDDQGRI